jgi:ribonuclease HII
VATQLEFRPSFEFERTAFEKQGWVSCGVDEVGRGCIAGPVVAAAVVFDPIFYSKKISELPLWIQALNDSKKLSPKKRKELFTEIKLNTKHSIAWCSVEEIDEINILQASFRAMRRALEDLSKTYQTLLVDGHQSPLEVRFGAEVGFAEKHKIQKVIPVVKGDQRSITIAAASIIAKVYRDEWMERLENEFPGYGLAVHKGYPTSVHQKALKEIGVSAIHRKSFGPVKELL